MYLIYPIAFLILSFILMISSRVINYSLITYRVIIIEFPLVMLLAPLCGGKATQSSLLQDSNSHCCLFIPIILISMSSNQILFAHT